MTEKKKVSEAQKRATAKFEKKAYFKVLVRFPIDKEQEIRAAAGDSLNGYIVQAVLEKIARDSCTMSGGHTGDSCSDLPAVRSNHRRAEPCPDPGPVSWCGSGPRKK